MKDHSFMKYLLNESKFDSKDFTNPKHRYAADVVDYILTNKKIGLGKDKVEKEISIDNKSLLAFKELQRKQNFTMADFDAAALSSGFKWTQIYKGTFSGHTEQSKGEGAEAAVCYLFNTYTKKNGFSQEAIDKCKNNGVSEAWIGSSKASANKILSMKFDPNSYIALHVDGHDFDNVEDKYAKVAKIYKGKPGIYEVLGISPKSKAFDSLYTGGKDNWNKADIVLVQKSKNPINAILKAAPKNPTELNSILNELVEKKQIIPISLKAIKSGTAPDKITFHKEGGGAENTIANDITSVKIKWPIKGEGIVGEENEPNNPSGSCYLVSNNGVKIQFRKQTNGDNLSIELILKGARGGKPLSKIKNEFTIVGNEYYVSSKDEKDLVKNLNKAKDFDVSTSEIPNEIKSIKGWYNKICFKGLCGLINVFTKKFKQSSIVDLFKFIYQKATGNESDSIFYLLTMA